MILKLYKMKVRKMNEAQKAKIETEENLEKIGKEKELEFYNLIKEKIQEGILKGRYDTVIEYKIIQNDLGLVKNAIVKDITLLNDEGFNNTIIKIKEEGFQVMPFVIQQFYYDRAAIAVYISWSGKKIRYDEERGVFL